MIKWLEDQFNAFHLNKIIYIISEMFLTCDRLFFLFFSWVLFLFCFLCLLNITTVVWDHDMRYLNFCCYLLIIITLKLTYQIILGFYDLHDMISVYTFQESNMAKVAQKSDYFLQNESSQDCSHDLCYLIFDLGLKHILRFFKVDQFHDILDY